MDRLHAWILRLLHLVIAVVRRIFRLSSQLASAFESRASGKPFSDWTIAPTTAQRRGAAQLKRLSHLAIVILEERLSYADLANIVVWSRQYGVACVTLYNPAGAAELDACQLRSAITRAEAKSDFGSKYSVRTVDYYSEKRDNVSDDQQLLHNGNDQRSECACIKTSLSSSCRTTTEDRTCGGDLGTACRVLLLPRLDGGHGLIVAAARARARAMSVARRRSGAALGSSCCGDGAGGVSTPESLLQEDLGGRLSVASPEAAVLFGGVTNLCGYLPWHVRLTEIFTLPSHLGLRHHEFLGIMQSYGSTEQRLGT